MYVSHGRPHRPAVPCTSLGHKRREDTMRSALVGSALTTFLMNWVCLAQEPQSPHAEFDALVKAQRDSQAAFNTAYAAAKTNEEKQQVLKEYGGRSPQQQGASFAALIEKYPNDPVAIKALDWLFQ